MSDMGIIDRFVDTFSGYIDSGFGLLGADVHFLTAFLIGIDITLAGVYWAMGSDSNVIGKFLKKVLYVGVFALIITNFSYLAGIIFESFGALGLKASGSTLTAGDLMRPGFVAATGFEAAHPLLDEVGELTGPVKFFTNIVTIIVLMLFSSLSPLSNLSSPRSLALSLSLSPFGIRHLSWPKKSWAISWPPGLNSWCWP